MSLDKFYKDLGKFVVILSIAVITSVILGKVFMYSFNDVCRNKHKLEKYEEKNDLLVKEQIKTEQNLQKIADHLCKERLNKNYSYLWTIPTGAEFGINNSVNALVCQTNNKPYFNKINLSK